MTSIYLFVLLMGLGTIAILASCGALIRFYAAQQGNDPSLNIGTPLYAHVFLQLFAKLLVATAIGVIVNQWTDINLAPVLTMIIENSIYWPDLWSHLRPSMVIGLHAGFIMSLFFIFVYPILIPERVVSILTQLRQCQGVVPRLLFEGILTEVVIRWGVLSFVYGLFDVFFGKVWWVQFVAVFFSAIFYAASRLPNLYSLYRSVTGADLFVVWLVGSGVGCVFGWIFVDHGILAVMLAHICYEVATILVDKYRPKWD
ncbi:MAG: hypothetical protein CMF48_04675 [Legionellales bacterium]|nr:hypothetical protein [Legionellales bacterium]|tara:strand:+ start:193 stop:963 length:771 start_codon:yes stop_codon:yes gene_type:complete